MADSDTATCDGRSVTITGTDTDDKLDGTDGDDVIAAGDGNDVVHGGNGNDVVCGGEGADRLFGDSGNDRLHGEADYRLPADTEYWEWYGDTLAGGTGDDLLDPGTDDTGGEKRVEEDAISFTRSRSGVEVDLEAGTATGEGTDTILGRVPRVEGSNFDDVILGSTDADDLSGWKGADTIDGRGGDDLIEANDGLQETYGRPDSAANHLIGGEGNDELSGSDGDDLIEGGPGRDRMDGNKGADRLVGGTDDDRLSDTLVAAAGQSMDGGPGGDSLADFYLLRPDGRDIAVTGSGRVDLAAGRITTTVHGRRIRVPLLSVEGVNVPFGAWVMIGTDSANRLGPIMESDTSVVIRAGAGNDTVSGTSQHDVLDGGPGLDRLWASGGDDAVSGFERRLG